MSQVPTNLSWERVVRVLKRAGFELRHEGRHTSLSLGGRIVVIPRHPRIKRETLRAIIKDSGLTIEEFKRLL